MIPATFHLVQFLGWKEDKMKQPQPKSRGSGSLDSFIDEIVEDDPQVQSNLKYGYISEEGEAVVKTYTKETSSKDTNKSKKGKSSDMLVELTEKEKEILSRKIREGFKESDQTGSEEGELNK